MPRTFSSFLPPGLPPGSPPGSPPGLLPSLLPGFLAGLTLALLDLVAVAPACRGPAQAALVFLAAGGVLAPALMLLAAPLHLLTGLARARALAGTLQPLRRPGLALLLALLLFYLDSRAYRRLYPAAHGLLLFMQGALLILSARGLLRARPPRWLGLAALAAAAALSGAAWKILSDPGVRHLVYQETTAARQPLSVLSHLSRRPAATGATAASSALGQGAGPGHGQRRPERAAAPARAVPPLPDLAGAHLVLVTIDTLRADRLDAVRGGRPLMPALSALASQGVRFDRAYAAAPHTAFSLASLLTGSPIRALANLRTPLPRTIAEHLAASGYRTHAILPDGIFFNGRRALAPYVSTHFGFAAHRQHDGTAAHATAAARAVIQELQDQGEPPALIFLHYFDPHEPYERRADHDFGAGTEARYDSEVAAVDDAIAELHGALASLLRPVVLVVTADHGEEFGDHGGYFHGSSLYDEQIRVPLVIVAPGLTPRRVAQAVSLMDVVPTALGLLDERDLPGGTGRDLGPLLRGEAPPAPVIAEVDTKRMVVKGATKLIHDQLRDTWEMYDLRADPRERDNRYTREPALAADLSADLYEWLETLHQKASEPEPIARGRLKDRRALPALGAFLRDEGQPAAQRAEAARLIGALEGESERSALLAALSDPIEEVRMEAALALAQLFDPRAVPVLEEELARPAHRLRAGIALGRLRRESAEPALIEALRAQQPILRRQAAVYLGRIGTAAAIAPLLGQKGDVHAGIDVALALGRIGARTGRDAVLGPLVEWLKVEEREDVVSELCRALLALGDRRAIPALLQALALRPGLSWAAAALVGLGALDRPGSALGGMDLGPGAAARAPGFSGCRGRDDAWRSEELGGAVCQLRRREAALRFPMRRLAPAYEARLRLQPGALDLGEATLALSLNGRPLPPQRMQPGWQELRVPISGDHLRKGENVLALRVLDKDKGPGLRRAGEAALLTLDWLLLIPWPRPQPQPQPRPRPQPQPR